MFYNPDSTVLCGLLRSAWVDIDGGNKAGGLEKICKIYFAIKKEMELFGSSGACQKKAEALAVKFYTAQSYGEYTKQSKKIRDKGKKVSSVLHPYQGIDQNAVDMAESAYQHVFDIFCKKAAKELAEGETERKAPWRFHADEKATDRMVLAFFKLRAAIAFADFIRERKTAKARLILSEPVNKAPDQIFNAIKNDIKSKVKAILRKKDQKFVNAWAAQVYSSSNRQGGHTKDIIKPIEVIYGVGSPQTVYNHLKPFNIAMQNKLEADDCKQEYISAIYEVSLNIVRKRDLLA